MLTNEENLSQGKNPHQVNFKSPLQESINQESSGSKYKISYQPTVEPLLQYPIRLDLVETSSFARIPVHD